MKQLRAELEKVKSQLERARAELLDPPADIQELVIKKLNLVSAEALDTERAELEKVKAECARLVAWKNGMIAANSGDSLTIHKLCGPFIDHPEPQMTWVDCVSQAINKLTTALDSERAANAGLREAFAQDQPWSLLETLSAAYDAIEHMMVQHDCDCHGWERFQQTKTAIGMLAPKIRQVLSTDAGKLFLDRLREAEKKADQCKNALDGWRCYFQSENDPDLDPETHGEEFHACWDLMLEALSDSPPTNETKGGK